MVIIVAVVEYDPGTCVPLNPVKKHRVVASDDAADDFEANCWNVVDNELPTYGPAADRGVPSQVGAVVVPMI